MIEQPAQDVIEALQALDPDSLDRIFRSLKEEEVLTACPQWKCNQENHGHMG